MDILCLLYMLGVISRNTLKYIIIIIIIIIPYIRLQLYRYYTGRL